ncbi:DUF6207 family protein [Streptomyces sp. NPDC001142]
MEPIHEQLLSEPGLVVLDITAADETTIQRSGCNAPGAMPGRFLGRCIPAGLGYTVGCQPIQPVRRSRGSHRESRG